MQVTFCQQCNQTQDSQSSVGLILVPNRHSTGTLRSILVFRGSCFPIIPAPTLLFAFAFMVIPLLTCQFAQHVPRRLPDSLFTGLQRLPAAVKSDRLVTVYLHVQAVQMASLLGVTAPANAGYSQAAYAWSHPSSCRAKGCCIFAPLLPNDAFLLVISCCMMAGHTHADLPLPG